MINGTLKSKLIEKSKEAFVMAIEIYNKPTIKYRVEGFLYLQCVGAYAKGVYAQTRWRWEHLLQG